MTPEFSRPVRIDTIGEGGRTIAVEADEVERAALAVRFGLLALDRLAAEIGLRREGDTIFAQGRIEAAVVQSCVASGTAVPAKLDEAFALRLLPEGDDAAEEIELDADEVDTVSYSGGAVALGEMTAETLALSLEPFPRAPDADAVLKAAGVLSEDEAREANGPFAALKGLKDRLR